VLSELLSWFAGKPENRRRYPRRAGGFRAWFASASGWVALTGVDISASGMGVISPAKFEKDELNFRIVVDDRPIMLRAKHVWCVPGTLQGRPVYRYGVHYTGIGADDWDALVRFCSNEAVNVENKMQKELELVRMQADDVARLIPQRLQQRLLAMLVQARRLAPLEKDKTPLVQYFYGGTVKHNGRQTHRLSIHSRVRDESTGESLSFDTRFLFDDSGTDIEMETR
jgi:PilZ domain